MESPRSSTPHDEEESCLQRISQNPRSYLWPIALSGLYSVVLIVLEWHSTCHGVLSQLTWQSNLISCIGLFLLYFLYLTLLSRRCCIRRFLKPWCAVMKHTCFGNAMLPLLWCLCGVYDWCLLCAQCNNAHVTVGYGAVLLVYCVTLLPLSLMQCIYGARQYRQRSQQKQYVENTQKQSVDTVPESHAEGRDTDDEKLSISPRRLPQIPEDKLPEFVQELDYFDGLDFSTSQLSLATPSTRTLAVELQLPTTTHNQEVILSMPTLSELKSEISETPHEASPPPQLVPPASLPRTTGTASPSPSIGNRSFGNLLLGEAREQSSTMFINLKKENSDDGLMCMVCLAPFQKHDKIGKLMCSHTFHKRCIYKWLKKKTTCPLCREDVKRFAQVSFL